MRTVTQKRFAQTLIALSALLLVTLFATVAQAYGRVQWTKTTLEEKKAGTQSRWNVELKIFLDKPPDFAHVPVKFEFKPIAYYERFLDDSTGDTPKERRVPLTNKQTIIESVDLGFLDPGTGKIQSRTKFGFRLTRAHGFEAGEYKVTIKNSRTGRTIGRTITLKLKGENEVIDRRAMVFAGKKDKEEDESSEEETEADTGAGEGSMDADPMDDPDNWPEVEREEPTLPSETKEKPGGCGCRAAGSGRSGTGVVALLLAGALSLARRRRRLVRAG